MSFLAENFPGSVLSFPMPAWTLWLLLAALLVLPVLLRLRVGDEGPDNTVVHESGDDEDPDGPDGLLAAALGFRS